MYVFILCQCTLLCLRSTDLSKAFSLKTYAAISHSHLFRVWKQVKLSGSCLSTFHGFGSTQLSDILIQYPCSDIYRQNKVIKVCPKYLLTFYQNLYFQYQRQINVAQAKSKDVHNYPGYEYECGRVSTMFWTVI